MKPHSIINRVGLIAVLCAGVYASGQEVHRDFDDKVDFRSFHTFCFTQVHASNQLVEGRLRDAVSSELVAKGWQPASGQCDVSVAAIGYVKSRQEYNTFYSGMGPGWGWGGRWGWGGWGGSPAITTVNNIPVGTLSIDLYETQNKSLVWRGTSKQELSDDPEKNADKLKKAVHKIFDKFPPKSKG